MSDEAARFWSLVDKTEAGCWVWRSAARRGGYGHFLSQGKMWLVHRLSWMWANGPIPEGLVMRHDCDNPPCVNPAHLRPGTYADNMADQLARDRRPAHPDPWMSLGTAARLLGVKRSSLVSQIHRGRLSASMFAGWHVRASEVERYRAASLGKPGRKAK